MMNRAAACAALLAIAFGPRAEAATCSVSATSVAFSAYDTLALLDDDATGTITVSCSTTLALAISYDIALSPGGSGSYSGRQLAAGSQKLGYNLYTSVLRSTVWGDGTGGSSKVADTYLLAIGTTSRGYTVYGRIPARQNVPAGTYTDSITVTVTY